MKKLRGLVGVILLVILDQVTKLLAKGNFEVDGPVTIIPKVFKLQYLENTGAAFGILKDKLLLFIILTSIVVLVIGYVYYKMPDDKRYIPIELILILITAGAIGNLIDRIVHNYVIDFLYFELINFPIFNVADCYVTISAILLLILVLFYYKEEDFNFLERKIIKDDNLENDSKDEDSF